MADATDEGEEQAPTVWSHNCHRQAGCGPLPGQPYIHLRYPECATRMHDMHGARTSREEACPFPSTSMAVKRARASTVCCQRQLVHRSPWLCIHALIFFHTAILHMAADKLGLAAIYSIILLIFVIYYTLYGIGYIIY